MEVGEVRGERKKKRGQEGEEGGGLISLSSAADVEVYEASFSNHRGSTGGDHQ